eukprot:CCRYP_001818-RA/>CCRYP_001818-RA protein AED:0.39 eAED:0.38 QI:0/-1/0/1/-1/1/1/0/475
MPGKVDTTKLAHGFTYLVTNGPASPPQRTTPRSLPTPKPPDTAPKKPPWIRRAERKQARVTDMEEFDALLEEYSPAASSTVTMLDSGTTCHLNKPTDGLQPTGPSRKTIITATGDTSTTTSTALLPMTQLPMAARETHILPNLQASLMSVSVLANNGCTTIFHPYHKGVTVHGPGGINLTLTTEALLQGWRDPDGLWRVPLTTKVTDLTAHTIALDRPAPPIAAYSVYELPSTEKVVRFLHAALGFPTKATMLAAARKGNLISFPGLTPDNISKFFPESDPTAKGHMRQTRQGVRSTKISEDNSDDDYTPTPGVKHKDVYLRVLDMTKKPMYSDQTGRFPITSSKGNKYLMIACEMDSNYIDAEPLKDRTKGALVGAYTAIFTRWKQTGMISPNWHILDNEAPNELKAAIRENGCRVELTPADMHRRNAAERAIQTFKGNFISVLAGVADDFPSHAGTNSSLAQYCKQTSSDNPM